LLVRLLALMLKNEALQAQPRHTMTTTTQSRTAMQEHNPEQTHRQTQAPKEKRDMRRPAQQA
jgi:hypothetical protein